MAHLHGAALRQTIYENRSRTKMRMNSLGSLAVVLCILAVSCLAHGYQVESRQISVAVIAPSVSTSVESRRIISRQGWTQGRFKTSDAILVVVRSGLILPLRSSYSFIGELKQDAEMQLNIAGPKFHVYLYQLGDDLECTQLRHISYDAE